MEFKSGVDTKEQLLQVIRDWVKIETDIQALQQELNAKKKEKKIISGNLIEVMKTNEIDCFKINDGKIQYKSQNVKKPLSNKMLAQLLNEFYSDNLLHAEKVNQFLLEHREETVREKIVIHR
jgi:hypothetical protein